MCIGRASGSLLLALPGSTLIRTAAGVLSISVETNFIARKSRKPQSRPTYRGSDLSSMPHSLAADADTIKYRNRATLSPLNRHERAQEQRRARSTLLREQQRRRTGAWSLIRERGELPTETAEALEDIVGDIRTVESRVEARRREPAGPVRPRLLLKCNQQVEIVLQLVLHANRSSRRCAGPTRANADSADTPVTCRRIIGNFTDRYVRDTLASIVLLDCFERAASQLFKREQRFWHDHRPQCYVGELSRNTMAAHGRMPIKILAGWRYFRG